MIELLAAALTLGAHPPSVVPVPIGPARTYRPPPAPPAVRAGRAVGGLRCSSVGATFRVHVELFAHRRAVVVPAGIGVARPYERRLGTVEPRGCSYPLRTTMPAGIVEVARGEHLRVGDLFRIWGQPLSTGRLLSFGSSSRVRAYVDGCPVDAAPGSIRLIAGRQIVLELGGYVPPHPSFLFPRGSR